MFVLTVVASFWKAAAPRPFQFAIRDNKSGEILFNTRLSYDDAALKAIAKKSHGNKGGARDLVRVIRKDIEDKVCELIVDNADKKLSGISVSAEEGEITIKESFKVPELEA